ncbi:hypothetical protein MFLO_01545 [Listeria floridensis FSL S10-1187]|uniref:Cupin type-2 domain-containing protein n=1 Tax=Listeria floridensis FSL S10-1187 TaxID=1265817 RepID=A0ABP3B4G3_9LIST|nr:cupin domain-containing protein [Listeria floridensis]EUJ33867.1 hypothetical protein MFLO_01545 [Listeria floridensis FSL S10-1187]
MLKKISFSEKFASFSEPWQPKIVGEINDTHVKVVKLEGEFVWHSHEHEDEMFIVVKGKLTIKFRDQDVHLSEGEALVIPKGIEHQPVAEDEVYAILIEPSTTVNTGNLTNERTYIPPKI